MKPTDWLRDNVDERLEGLFSEDAELLQKTVRDLIEQVVIDPEIEEILADTFETGVQEANDETMGLAWIAVVLGELRCEAAVGSLLVALFSEDEDFASAATRALRKIGPPAFETILEMIDDEDLAAENYVSCVQVLEGISMFAVDELRQRVEETLLRHVRLIARGISARKSGGASPEGTPAGGSTQGVEAASLALARLGVRDAKQAVETAHVLCDRTNLFVQEAIDIFEETPEGIPCPSSAAWDVEFRWAIDSSLPGGDLASLDEEESESSSKDWSPGEPRF